MRYISIVNWKQCQHYKFRTPPWIKLQTNIIDKYHKDGRLKDFYKLSDNAKLTYVTLLCLASRYCNNIPYENDKELKKLLGINRVELKPLLDLKNIEIASIDASTGAIIDASDFASG